MSRLARWRLLCLTDCTWKAHNGAGEEERSRCPKGGDIEEERKSRLAGEVETENMGRQEVWQKPETSTATMRSPVQYCKGTGAEVPRGVEDRVEGAGCRLQVAGCFQVTW